MIDFKKATAQNDFETIAKLAELIWRAHYIPIVGKPQIDYMLKKFQSAEAVKDQIANGYSYFIIKFEKNAIGYIAIKTEEDYLFLSKIYILETYRGKGFGDIAIDFVEEKALDHNLNGIRLTVNVNNANSIRFYEKLGFKNNRPLVTDIGNGFIMDDYEMIKEL